MPADRMLRREGPGFVVDLPLGLCHVDATLAMEATDAKLGQFGTFPMDATSACLRVAATRVSKHHNHEQGS